MDTSTYLPHLGLVGHDLRNLETAEIFQFSSEREFRICLLLAGEGSGEIGPLKLPEKRPMGWFLPRNEQETIRLRGYVDFWWFTFDWPQLEVAPLSNDLLSFRCFDKTRQTQRVKYVDEGDASRAVEHFKALHRAATRWEMTGELEVRSLLLILIAFFIDLPEELTRTGGHRALQEFRELLDRHAFDERSIKQLADEVGMSPEHLRNLFWERFGIQPHTYRAALRMAKARQLLMEPNRNVKEVAHLVGYPDALYFSRIFKQRYGVNPSEMLRKHRK